MAIPENELDGAGETGQEIPAGPKPERSIIGDKRMYYTTPERVLPGVNPSDIPRDIRFFIQKQLAEVGGIEYVTYIYKLVEDGGPKAKKLSVDKVKNFVPDEEYLALNFGPYSDPGYIWIAKFRTSTGEERGIQSEVIPIGSEWAARFQAQQRKVLGLPPAGGYSAPAPAPVVDQVALADAAEMRFLDKLERYQKIFQGGNSNSPSAAVESMANAAGRIIEKAVESNLKMATQIQETLRDEIDPPDDDDDDVPTPVPMGPELPAWLKPWVEMAAPWIDKITGGGPLGKAAATLIKADPRFVEIYQDPQKWPEAIAAISKLCGEGKAQKVVSILTGKQEPAPAPAPKSKGKKK